MTQSHSIEGVVVFRRAAPGAQQSQCLAHCGPGGHIVGRSLELHDSDGRTKAAFVRCAEDFINDRVLRHNVNEGRRVRLTVEVLEG